MLSTEACLGIGFDLVPTLLFVWIGGGVDEAENMRQMRVQNCTKSYSFTPFIIIEMAFANYVIKENTCITFEKSKRQEGSTKL